MSRPRLFRFGIQLGAATDGAQWAALAREAEALGYSCLLAEDHFGDQLAPLPALTAAAAVTERLRVGSLVFDNDFKHPVVTAKEAATLDLLSNGRMELGLGAGWMTADYERSGIPMEQPSVRVDRLEEAVAVIKGLFGGEPVSFDGRHYRITELRGRPTPVQRPGPPLFIGGGGRRMLALATREADIVGINPKLKAGRLDQSAFKDGVATTMDRKVALVRDAAGPRFDDIEINFLVFACVLTDDRQSAIESLATGFGLEPSELDDFPHALVGTEEQICQQIVATRDRWDASYFVVRGVDAIRAAAPVVARLAGT